MNGSSVSDWLIPSLAALVGAIIALVATLLTTGRDNHWNEKLR